MISSGGIMKWKACLSLKEHFLESADWKIMKNRILFLVLILLAGSVAFAQERPTSVKVYPKEIDDVLNNPGIGLTTFQRFNGDALNPGTGWTEGHPIDYQPFNGDLANKDYPQSSIAYFRVYWKYVEPEAGEYNWPMLDQAIRTAAERGQALMLRVAPYGTGDTTDVPAWYRRMVGEEKPSGSKNWRVDPEDPRYVQYFGGLIRALGQRYDGHPDLESVDMAIVGPWGEGEGTHLLTQKTRAALLNGYLDHFSKTPLHYMPSGGGDLPPGILLKGTNIAASWPDRKPVGSHHVGYRFDCWGDYNPSGNTPNNWGQPHSDWSHMRDCYPCEIIKSGMADSWKKAPVSMEICWTFMKWHEDFQWNDEVVSHIINEAVKLHVSSFNAKSSPVPDAWRPLVDQWLNRMGYRLVIRQFIYPSAAYRQGRLSLTSVWENVGCAPIYKDYQLAVRLRHEQKTVILPASVDIRQWLPGDIVWEESLELPDEMPLGTYHLEVAIVAPATLEPRVRLAIEGRADDGWYPMGEIEIREPDMKNR